MKRTNSSPCGVRLRESEEETFFLDFVLSASGHDTALDTIFCQVARVCADLLELVR